MLSLGKTVIKSYTLMCRKHCAVIEFYTVRVPGVRDTRREWSVLHAKPDKNLQGTWDQSSAGKVVPKIHLYMI